MNIKTFWKKHNDPTFTRGGNPLTGSTFFDGEHLLFGFIALITVGWAILPLVILFYTIGAIMSLFIKSEDTEG